MKAHFWRQALMLAALLALVGCNLLTTGQSGGIQTTFSGPPVVRLAAPLPNATYLENVAVNVQAQVTNAGPDINRVEVVIDGAVAANLPQPNTAGAPAFSVSYSWQARGVGSHSISVTAFRADGSSSAPATVSINVVAQGAPPAAPSPTNTLPPPPAIGGEPPPPTAGGQPPAQAAPSNTPAPPAATSTPEPPAATATPSKPTATTTQGVNVRRGPGIVFDPPVGSMPANSSAEVIAVNPQRSWYKLRSQYGEGWVTAQYLSISGDVGSVPVDAGPPTPIPVTPTPTPVPATATPTTNINLVAGQIRLDPAQPRCGETFRVSIDVANFGTSPAPSGSLAVQDIHVASGAAQQTTSGGFPAIQPGQTVNSGPIPITVSTFFAERHRIVIVVDPNNQIAETNESDNRAELEYTLDKGSC